MQSERRKPFSIENCALPNNPSLFLIIAYKKIGISLKICEIEKSSLTPKDKISSILGLGNPFDNHVYNSYSRINISSVAGKQL